MGGKITKEEFHDALLEGYPEAERESRGLQVVELFDAGDIDGDGLLEFNEFACMCFDWSSVGKDTLVKYVEELPADINRDTEPSISREELVNFLGENCHGEELFYRLAGTGDRVN